ncbi:MAG: hypothetical protein HOI81_06440 [Nitrosomonadales bacterium]|nr:hypothetical protein [Nitrosomonadales bacterium]
MKILWLTTAKKCLTKTKPYVSNHTGYGYVAVLIVVFLTAMAIDTLKDKNKRSPKGSI